MAEKFNVAQRYVAWRSVMPWMSISWTLQRTRDSRAEMTARDDGDSDDHFGTIDGAYMNQHRILVPMVQE